MWGLVLQGLSFRSTGSMSTSTCGRIFTWPRITEAFRQISLLKRKKYIKLQVHRNFSFLELNVYQKHAWQKDFLLTWNLLAMTSTGFHVAGRHSLSTKALLTNRVKGRLHRQEVTLINHCESQKIFYSLKFYSQKIRRFFIVSSELYSAPI